MSNYEKKYFESSQSMYNRISGSNDNSNRMESVSVFRDGLSTCHLTSSQVTGGKNCRWSPKNKGGVPMDYDPKANLAYVDGSDAHTLLIGATGSKKSRLVVMPTVRILGAAGESMVICDPKAEIYQRTSGYLKQLGYDLHVVNLRDPSKGDGWNILEIPFKLYYSGEIDKACEYINDQAAALIPINSKDPYWDYSSRDLYVGLVLLLFELSIKFGQGLRSVNMQNLLRLKTDLFTSTVSREIKKTNLWAFADKHELIRTKLHGIVICPSDTMGCILSVFDQYLSCFSLQPQIINLLNETTLKLDRIGYEKTAIFLIMPDEKSTYHKLITVFIKQVYELLIDQAYTDRQHSGFPVRVNFLLDEFSSLPTISDFPQMIAASRSRNIRFTLVIQSKHQIQQRYEEEAETIQSNCANWMFLNSREVPLLQEISTLAGEKGNKPLIPVSRLQHLDKEKGECLIFAGRLYPYIACLPDISEYDHNDYREWPMPKRNLESDKVISFVPMLEQKQSLSSGDRTLMDHLNHFPPTNIDFNVDDLVKKIDAKIAELEAEEAAERARLQASSMVPSAAVPYQQDPNG